MLDRGHEGLPLRTVSIMATIDTLESELDARRQMLASVSDEVRALRQEKRISFAQVAFLVCATFYLRTARRMRWLSDHTVVWRHGGALLLVAAGTAVLVWLNVSASGVICFAIGWVTICLLLFFVPEDPKIIDYQIALLADLESARLEKEQIGDALRSHLLSLAEVRRECNSIEYRLSESRARDAREQRLRRLLEENWKCLRSIEFEGFLERVFKELGYCVETTKTSGDQGVDLIISRNELRIAIQVKGYLNSVSNGAVQEAYAGMTYYKCGACVVVTNSRFTSSAEVLAREVGCVLVDEDTLPQLVLGRFDLFSQCFRVE